MELNLKIKILTLAGLLASMTWGALCSLALSDWTSFRAGGESRVESALPVRWGAETGIAWQHELPGYGQSTPLIFQKRVYVTAVEGTLKEQCMVLCYELGSGEELWRVTLKSANPSPSNYMASRAAPTPIVDEQAVYAFFETGDVVAVDLQGEQLWHRDLTADYGKFDNNHGLGASPAHNAAQLFLNVEHRGPSYLLALDKSSGETAWKVDRNSGSSWSSPIVANCNGSEQVIVSSGGSVTGYSVGEGAQQWTLDGLDGNTVPSPTAIGNKLFIGARLPEFAEEGSVRSNCCIDLSAVGASGPAILWRSEKAVSDYCSPVQAGDVTYFVNKGGILYCVNSQSGELHYVKRLGTDCWGTPIVAGDLVYFFGKDGKTQVIKASAQYELVASNPLWDENDAPKPEHYVEHIGQGHGHGGGYGDKKPESSSAASDTEAGASSSNSSDGAPSRAGRRGSSGGPGGGMMAAMMAGDKNSDGILQADEISADFKPMLARIDTNQDGSLDAAELKAMTESFAVRRADSQAAARDPIVYGAAASDGRIVIRTGTRLYCIQ